MTKDIPEIDDLLKGINDPEMTLTDGHTETTIENQSAVTLSQEESTEERFTPVSDNSDYWQNFLSYLESDTREDKGERMICKLDRDLADSLDECNIHNRSRSDMVNAIVRTFFDIYLLQLVPFRREKKSLFTNFNQKDYEKEKN